MADTSVKRKLTAVLYADIAGYSRLSRRDENNTHREVMALLDQASGEISAGGGRVLRYAGDAILAAFDSAVNATETAIAIQRSLAASNESRPEADRLQLRIGLNIGDVIEDRGEIYGDGVNLAARLETAAVPGGICLSSFVRDHIVNKVDIELEDGGQESFKNIDQPIHVYRWHPHPGAPSPEYLHAAEIEDRETIAVLPFANLSSDPDQDYFADGITEDIITELSREKDLFVIARNSTAVYKGQTPDIKRIGAELGVQYVLEGSVRRHGEKIRLSAQLIEAATNAHLWAERYDRSLQDLFEVQDDLCNTIINTLLQKIRVTDIDRKLRYPRSKPIAYDHYLRSVGYLFRLSKADNARALDEAQRALELDPGYSRGHAMAAFAHFYNVWAGWGEDPEASLENCHSCALRAIGCDKDDFWAHAALAFAELLRHNHDRAESAINHAIALNPNSADCHAMHAAILNFVGKPEQAVDEIALAMRHNPIYPNWYLMILGRTHFMLQRYQEALPYLERLLNAGDEVMTFRSLLAATYMALGRESAAREQVDRLLGMYPDVNLAELESLFPAKSRDTAKRYIDLLRSAGVPD